MSSAIPEEPSPTTLFNSITTFMVTHMRHHDPSHDVAHVHRVVALARRILASEQQHTPGKYDAQAVRLAALLHDIGDWKYATTGSGSEEVEGEGSFRSILQSHGADPALAERVQKIVSHVSYTTERAKPDKIRQLTKPASEGGGGCPELAIVQDADRLDAIGAVGIGRCFTFLGAKGDKMARGKGESWELGSAIRHFEKLEGLESMMKTRTGREMASERTERLRILRGWWEEETHVAGC